MHGRPAVRYAHARIQTELKENVDSHVYITSDSYQRLVHLPLQPCMRRPYLAHDETDEEKQSAKHENVLILLQQPFFGRQVGLQGNPGLCAPVVGEEADTRETSHDEIKHLQTEERQQVVGLTLKQVNE